MESFYCEYLTFSELGTVWVDHRYRGQGLGRKIIDIATSKMFDTETVPLAVCNESSWTTFEQAGYTYAGDLQPKNDHERKLLIFEPNKNPIVSEYWDQGLKREAQSFIQSLPRFAEVTWL